MFDFLSRLFDPTGFPARWNCGDWTPELGWLHIVSDIGIWSAYVAIPCVLIFFVLRRKDVPFPKVFWLFGAFILACGMTHLMEAIIFWWPLYRLAGVIKLFTAVVSWGTVVALVPIIPKALAMRGPEMLEQEIAARTAQLAKLNEQLRAEIAEHKQTGEELREQREQLHITLTSIGDAVIVTDAQGRVTSLNPVAQTLTGWGAEGVGKPLHEVFNIVNEMTRQPAESPVAKVLQEGVVVGLANHTVLIAKDGTERPIDDSAAPIRGGDNNIFGVVLVFRDVTQRRKMDALQRDIQNQLERQVQERTAELRASEERFRLVVEGTKDYAIFMLDSHGHVASWNPGAQRINGYLAEEIVGQHFSRFYPAEDVQAAKPQRELQAASTEGKYEEEGWRVRKDGSRFWSSVVITALRDDQGRLRGFSKITRDITEKKQAEENARRLELEQAARSAAEEAREQLQASEQRARFVAEASKALAGLVDYQSTLQKLANLAVPFFADWCAVDMVEDDGSVQRVAVAHVDPAKVELAKDLIRRFPPDLSAPRGMALVLRTGSSDIMPEIADSYLETTIKNKELLNTVRQLAPKSYLGVPLKVRGTTLGVISFVGAESSRRYGDADLAVAEDLAHRVAIAVENARLYSEARQADRRKDEFLAMLAHELRNPLAPIRNGLHILKQPGTDRDMAEQVRAIMERQVQHMTRMVDDLLDVSRITRGKIELRKQMVDLAAIVSRTVDATRPLIDDRNHELTISLPRQSVLLEADPTRLEQVLANLLNNAAKFTEQGGRIVLSAEQQGNELVVRVQDSGIGIPADMVNRIFEPFVQSNQVLSHAAGGLGIGLALVRSLVEMHNGSVAARSDGPGQGSEFIIRLPVVVRQEKSNATDGETESPAPAAETRKRRIMVVDDNRDAAESLAMVLTMQGHDVQVAHDGAAALAVADGRPLDIVFLDIGMPVMNGYEVAKVLRQRDGANSLLLVAMTGWGQAEDRRRSQEAGFDYHLVKPVEPEALENLLNHFNSK